MPVNEFPDGNDYLAIIEQNIYLALKNSFNDLTFQQKKYPEKYNHSFSKFVILSYPMCKASLFCSRNVGMYWRNDFIAWW